MEFDISRCYSAINADELRAGDKVLTSNNIASLKEAVRLDVKPSVIVSIWGEMYNKRFQCKSSDTIYDAELVYLVERKENCTNCVENGRVHGCIPMDDDKLTRCFDYKPKTEPHYRPFHNTDELIKVWKEKSKQVHSEYSLTMPYIWVRRKGANTKGQLITEFGDELHVSMGKEGYNMTDLFVYFTFLDGSVCGVEE